MFLTNAINNEHFMNGTLDLYFDPFAELNGLQENFEQS